MKSVEKNLVNALKVITIGCWIGAAKLYSEARYYQGRIDASKQMEDFLQGLVDKLQKNREQKEEEA